MRRFALSLVLAVAAVSSADAATSEPNPAAIISPGELRTLFASPPPPDTAAPASSIPAPRVPGAKPPEAPPPRPPRPNTLNDLFERLVAARDETEGKGIANLIERRWGRSGSDTADLLMSRAGEAARAKDTALAIELLDRVLALEPRWAEAWYRRANVFFMMDDPVTALADLRQALTIEPRHYGAWAGLGNIYLSFDDKRGALDAYRRALRLYPQQETIRTRVERLAPQIDGQDL